MRRLERNAHLQERHLHARQSRSLQMPYTVIAVFLVSALLAGCSSPARQSGATGSRESVRLQQPPDKAAACFARNAEEHSSALVAEIHPRGDSFEVIVRVKNGVLYGTGDFRRAGNGSSASIVLMVTTTGRRSDLMDALLEGC
jgi:hypothetical protein